MAGQRVIRLLKKRAAKILLLQACILLLLFAVDRLLKLTWYRVTYNDYGLGIGYFFEQREQRNDFVKLSPHYHLLWRNKPNIRLKLALYSVPLEKRCDYVLQTNSRGFRAQELARGKSPGALRVFTLGDSCTMGAGVSEEDTYSTLLGGLLRREFPGRAIEVLNTGTDGWTSRQGGWLLANELAAFEPDFVTAAFEVNDYAYLTSYDARQRALSRPLVAIQGALNRSMLYYTLKRGILWGAGALVKRDREPASFPEDPDHTLEELYAANLEHIVQAARRAGAEPIFLSIPTQVEEKKEGQTEYQIVERSLTDVMGEVAERRGVRHVRLLGAFKDADRGHLFVDDVHPSTDGHGIIARELLSAVKSVMSQ